MYPGCVIDSITYSKRDVDTFVCLTQYIDNMYVNKVCDQGMDDRTLKMASD